MGVIKDAALLRTIERAGQTEAELLAQLLAEQQRTNALLTQLLGALGARQAQSQGTTWGLR